LAQIKDEQFGEMLDMVRTMCILGQIWKHKGSWFLVNGNDKRHPQISLIGAD
jgi:hypothetical protein